MVDSDREVLIVELIIIQNGHVGFAKRRVLIWSDETFQNNFESQHHLRYTQPASTSKLTFYYKKRRIIAEVESPRSLGVKDLDSLVCVTETISLKVS